MCWLTVSEGSAHGKLAAMPFYYADSRRAWQRKPVQHTAAKKHREMEGGPREKNTLFQVTPLVTHLQPDATLLTAYSTMNPSRN